MNNHKLTILYVISTSRTRRDKKASLFCRITYNKSRKQFSTGQFINPSNWLSKQQSVKPDEPDAELKNTQLSLIKTKLSQAFLFLQVKGTDFNVEDVYSQYKGETPKRNME